MKKKYFTLLSFAVLICPQVFTQPLINHQKVTGGSGDDFFSCMNLTKDSGIIMGGYSYSNISGDKTENSRGYSDYWIVLLDKTGKIKWDKTIGGSDGDAVQSIQQTSDGGYILGGYSFSSISGEKTENSRGTSDYWVIKLDSTGNIQWDKTYGGNSTEWLFAIQQTTDKGYILSGHSYSEISGEKSGYNRGDGDDYWIVKIDQLGNIQWEKTIGGNNSDELPYVQQTNDGGYILGGSSYSGISGEKTENSRGMLDYWIVKLDKTGNIEWDKTIGGSGQESLYCINQTSDGGYILGGTSESKISGEKTQRSRGSYDYWVVKLTGTGSIEWDKTIGGEGYDDLFSLQQTLDNGYILAGTSGSNISGEKTENSRGGSDYWVVKLNSRGKIQWDKTIGGDDNDGFSFSPIVKELKKDSYAVSGYTNSGISEDKTKPSRGGFDYWLITLNYKKIPEAENLIFKKPTNIITKRNFTIYPNPVKDMLHIQTSGKVTIKLTDQSGKTILTKIINGKGEISVAHLPAGLYYITEMETGTVKKILISR